MRRGRRSWATRSEDVDADRVDVGDVIGVVHVE